MNHKSILKTGWNFDNSYSRLPQSFFTNLNPEPVKLPKLVKLNLSLAKDLNLNVRALQSDDGVSEFSGNLIPEGSLPLAQAYAGHQYGYFTMLGDGRALLIGEHITPKGQRFDIQLKGSGRTPYSRSGDGRATLGPMLREYIISEAMFALGIPTTRSLAVVTTGEPVIRETILPGAILTRIAASHIRVGTFQYVSKWGSKDELQVLTDYTMKRHYPHIKDDENKYLAFLKEVIKSQALLVAKWQLVGFIHGVMNTDNMTISGETIDYGPCAFMDSYDPATVFSSIDTYGRYAYANQPIIAKWNLTRLAETLLTLLNDNQDQAVELVNSDISEFDKLFKNNWITGMKSKLGIFNDEPQDEFLFENLLNILHKQRADYTNTFVELTFNKPEEVTLNVNSEFKEWYNMWQARIDRQAETKENSLKLMKNSNPAIIPRNHRVEEALEAAVKEGDLSVMEKLLDVLLHPYDHSPEQAEYTKLPSSSCPYKTFCGT